MEAIEEATQNTLFDLSAKEFNIMWVDEKAPLSVPNNPMHWKAHKLQTLIARLEKQAERNPAQFNSKNYIDVLNEFERLMLEIKEGQDETYASTVGAVGDTSEAPAMGEGNAVGLDIGVSADNPTARQRPDSV
jgi:hypothetical protein